MEYIPAAGADVDQRAIEGRVERCERIIRRLSLALVLVTLLALGALGVNAPLFRSGVAESIQVRELVVLDDQDVVRVRLGGDLPDAVVDGRTLTRGEAAAGILLYDDSGLERSGYVTFSPGGHVALTLDTKEQQVALFAAGPDGGVVARLWEGDGSDWVEMRAGSDGSSFNAGQDGVLVFQQPSRMASESAAFCASFRAEADQLSPRPPLETLLEACSRYASEMECRLCLDSP